MENNIHLFETDLAYLAAVMVPEGAANIDMNNVCGFLGFDDTETGSFDGVVSLPPGNWSFLGLHLGLTEEQCIPLVDSLPQGFMLEKRDYMNYEIDRPMFSSRFTCKTAAESMQSLLRREQIYSVNPYWHFEPERELYVHEQEYLVDLDLWQAAQERTGTFAILYRLK